MRSVPNAKIALSELYFTDFIPKAFFSLFKMAMRRVAILKTKYDPGLEGGTYFAPCIASSTYLINSTETT